MCTPSPKFPLRSSSLPFVSLQVADQYAFIPREAISKFLLFCIDCQRKNSMENRRATNGNGGIKAGKDCRAEDNGSPLNSSLGGDTPTPNDYRPLSPPPSLVIDHFRHSPISLNGTNGTQAGMQHVLTTAAVAGGVASLTSTPHLSPPTTPKSASPASSSAALSVTAAAAFTQAMAAMQNHPLRSLQMRNTLLAANPQSNPFLATQALLSAGGNNGYGNSNVPCVGSAPVAGSSKFDFVRSESPHLDAGYGTSYGSLSNGHQQRQQQQERYLERQQEDRELAEFLVKKFNIVTFGYSGTG